MTGIDGKLKERKKYYVNEAEYLTQLMEYVNATERSLYESKYSYKTVRMSTG